MLFANAVLLQVPLKPIQRHFIQRQLHQPQAHLIDGEIMKAAVLAETDQTATRVYPVSHQIFDQVPLVTKKDRASACPAIS